MAKRTLKRPQQYEQDQTGCIWGLISIFDFRHGRSTRKLLSDRRRGSRHALGTGYSKRKLKLLADVEEKCQGTDGADDGMTESADAAKPSVKKLIEEELISELDPKKQISSAEVEQKQADSEQGGQGRKNLKRTNKTCKKTCNVHIHDSSPAENLGPENSCHQNSNEQCINNLDINAIMEELCRQIHQKSISCDKHDQQSEVHMQSNHNLSDFEETLSEATKMFINQKFVNGEHPTEDARIHHSKEFMDALQTLISNEELFLKLLEDPNSLLVKCIQNLQDTEVGKDKKYKSIGGSYCSEKELCKSSEELVSRKQNKFFWRKVKSQQSNSSKEDEDSQASNKIVILKPGPASLQNSETESGLGLTLPSHYIVRNNGPSERGTSHFSLTEIKRKLKHAMGKERHDISPDSVLHRFPHKHQNSGGGEKSAGGENFGRNSPSKDHFYTERIVKPSLNAKRGDKNFKLENYEISMEDENAGFSKPSVSEIYAEAKKHLSEMLNNGDGDEDSSSRQVPKTLGRILSLPEYNFSPICSPGRDWNHSFVTAQMRFAACNKFWKVSENTGRLKQENIISPIVPSAPNVEIPSSNSDDNPADKVQAPTSNANISDEHIHDNEVKESSCEIKDEMCFEGDVDVVKTIDIEESNVLDVSNSLSGSSIARDDQRSGAAEICDAEGYSEGIKMEAFQENQPPSSPLASPSSSSIPSKVEDLDGAIDRMERPSPISVLEPLFTEDDISPASNRSPHAEPPIPPLRIQFEEQDASIDQGTHLKTCTDDRDCTLAYVKAVLQASGLHWDEFFIGSLSTDPLLDPSLFNEIKFFPNQLCYDQKILFDCINEVLMEVFQHYFGCSPWVSFVKPNIRPVLNMENAIQEVWEGVYWHLVPQPLPHTLDQIVQKDMAKSRRWMDLRFDAETVGIEMCEIILDELMEDTILSCANENLESEFSVLSAEAKENEGSINL